MEEIASEWQVKSDRFGDRDGESKKNVILGSKNCDEKFGIWTRNSQKFHNKFQSITFAFLLNHFKTSLLFQNNPRQM